MGTIAPSPCCRGRQVRNRGSSWRWSASSTRWHWKRARSPRQDASERRRYSSAVAVPRNDICSSWLEESVRSLLLLSLSALAEPTAPLGRVLSQDTPVMRLSFEDGV